MLAAYGLDDGRERWTVPVDQSLYLTTVEGRLFGWSQDGYVAFGKRPTLARRPDTGQPAVHAPVGTASPRWLAALTSAATSLQTSA